MLSLAPSAQAQESWNQWRGPHRNGVWADVELPEDLQDSLQLVWEQTDLSPSYSGPVVIEGTVYSTETVDRQIERVTAYNLASGEQRWQVTWPGSLAVPFFAASNGDWIRATPAVESGHLVVSSMRDVLVCLDPQTGDEKWKLDFAKQLGTRQPSFGNVCSPLIDGDSIYVQAGQAVTKLSLADGSVQWQAMKNDEGMSSSGAFSSPVIAELAGERQLVVQTRETLAGLRLTDGKVLWQQAIPAFRGMNILTPLIQDDTVFTSAYGGRSEMFRVRQQADQSFTVEPLWENKAQGYMSSPIRIKDHIYLHLRNQRIVCIDANSGKETWTSKPFGKYQSWVSDGERILALDQAGTLLLIAADPTELKILDSRKVADNSWAHLAVQDRFVIVRKLNALSVFGF
ncbi:PQQ-binding-like beta-propeller repeat protein [Roseimaritima ulvae]|nr:PQQ-binding-like beta-propeller repeat protein [Roseimaritima ulvae]